VHLDDIQLVLMIDVAPVPVILVLTKFDIVVSKVLFEIAPDDPQQHGRARADAHAMYEDSCRRLFHKDVPTEVVSGTYSLSLRTLRRVVV
jgi:hypothetical protein